MLKFKAKTIGGILENYIEKLRLSIKTFYHSKTFTFFVCSRGRAQIRIHMKKYGDIPSACLPHMYSISLLASRGFTIGMEVSNLT